MAKKTPLSSYLDAPFRSPPKIIKNNYAAFNLLPLPTLMKYVCASSDNPRNRGPARKRTSVDERQVLLPALSMHVPAHCTSASCPLRRVPPISSAPATLGGVSSFGFCGTIARTFGFSSKIAHVRLQRHDRARSDSPARSRTPWCGRTGTVWKERLRWRAPAII